LFRHSNGAVNQFVYPGAECHLVARCGACEDLDREPPQRELFEVDGHCPPALCGDSRLLQSLGNVRTIDADTGWDPGGRVEDEVDTCDRTIVL
jgi:hypothetical protein